MTPDELTWWVYHLGMSFFLTVAALVALAALAAAAELIAEQRSKTMHGRNHGGAVTLDLSPDARRRLKELADRDQLKREGVVRRGVALYEAVTSAQRAGAVLLLRHADGREEELVLAPPPAPLASALPAKG